MRITYSRREGQMLSTYAYISVSKLKLCVRLIFHMMSCLQLTCCLEMQQTARGEMDASPRVYKFTERRQFLQ